MLEMFSIDAGSVREEGWLDLACAPGCFWTICLPTVIPWAHESCTVETLKTLEPLIALIPLSTLKKTPGLGMSVVEGYLQRNQFSQRFSGSRAFSGSGFDLGRIESIMGHAVIRLLKVSFNMV